VTNLSSALLMPAQSTSNTMSVMRSKPDTDDLPVLIVGAGPAGLTAAVTLARHGVASLLVERRRDLSALPRATSLSTRTMELLRSWGLEREVRAGGVDVVMRMWQSETLARVSEGAVLPGGFPTGAQSALVSPTAAACVPQDRLEPVLLRHLRSLGASRVQFGSEVIHTTASADGVHAEIRDVGTGGRRAVHARYLIGADGAHSSVRSALGIRMRGPSELRDAVSTLFRASLWQLLDEHRYCLYTVSQPDHRGIFLPVGPGDRWLYGLMLDPGERPAGFTEDVLIERIRSGAGVTDLRLRIERIGRFSFAAQVADTFRSDSAFLVGDAAHRAIPRGATGLNTAIHDGYDLGWKLAWVLNGWAPTSLLHTYETERRPVAEHNVQWSANPNASQRPPEDPLAVDLGGRIPHVWLPSGRVSTLDLLGHGLTAFTGPNRRAAVPRTGPTPLIERRLDAITARALGIPTDGTLLVRPDGRPAALIPGAASAAANSIESLRAGGLRSRAA
jgi:putative polyketide hydroxylase